MDLKSLCLPKEGFQKTYATFSTDMVPLITDFALEIRHLYAVPDGIAHFLEHKMFEEPTGDIFATFASKAHQPTLLPASTAPYIFSRRRSKLMPIWKR